MRLRGFHSPLWLGALLLLAALLRFWDLGGKSLWGDELDTLRVTDLATSGQIVDALAHYRKTTLVNPPAYFLAVHGVSLFSRSEAALRAVSAVAGTLAVLAFFFLARLFLPRRHALGAAALFAIAPVAVFYSQENRPYALTLLETTAAAYGLFGFLLERRPWQIMLFLFASASALYTNYVSILFLGCLAVSGAAWLAIGWRAQADRKRLGLHLGVLAAAGGALLILYLPWLPTAMDFLRVNSLSNNPRFRPHDLETLWANLLGLPERLWPVAWVLMGLFVAVAIRGRRWWDLVFLLPVCILPLGVLAVGRPMHYHYRHAIYMLPFLLIAVWRGVVCGLGEWAGSRGRRIAVWSLVALAWLPMNLHALADYYGNEKEDWRRAVAYLEQHARPGDHIITGIFFVEDAIAYYYRTGPREVTLHKGVLSQDQFLEASRSAPRVWYITSFHYMLPGWVREIVDKHYTLEKVVPGKTEIYVYLKDDYSPALRAHPPNP